MATVAEPRAETYPPLQRFLMHDVPWSAYEALLEAAGESHVRVTYDRGEMELMTLSPEHERSKVLLFLAFQILTEERDLALVSLGSTTYRREDLEKGLEPDTCFYLENFPRILAKKRLDLSIDPPPDLAIEVDVTHGSIDRQGIYEALGVPSSGGSTVSNSGSSASAPTADTRQSSGAPTSR